MNTHRIAYARQITTQSILAANNWETFILLFYRNIVE